MRIYLVILFLVVTVKGFSNGDPVQWNIESTRVDDHTYHLLVKGDAEKGWYVYQESDSENGLDGVQVKWDNESVIRVGELLSDGFSSLVNDKIFSKKIRVFTDKFELLQVVKIENTIPAKLKVIVQGYASNGNEFLPIEVSKEVELEGGIKNEQRIKIASIDISKPVAACGGEQNKSKSLLGIFLLGFGGGLLALLTPCIFPMIPVTVSFFSQKAKVKRQKAWRDGFLYGLCIFLIYLVGSVPFHLIGNINPQIFNTISTNAWVNVFFFAVFILFALSFFGVFEIKLPASIANATGSKSGIFFLALTLVIVSFSCTGIILGSLLVNALSVNGNAWQLTAGMGGFGAALGIPFALFALFPQWLKKVPKSGGWMETLKKSLAFVELAFAVKFLSNADLVEHWGILKREVFIGLWILIGLGLGIYLLNLKWFFRYGKLNVSKVRIAFALLSFIAVIYLIPGLGSSKYANLKLLSGFAPPLSYSVYGKNNVKGKGLEPDVINDYEKALALAKEQNKPLLIDFTGWACVNCRKMEEHVWTRPEISFLIREKYILVSLYVDDRKKLPAEQRFSFKNSEGKERDIETIGNKYAAMQEENFKQVTQPMYAIISPGEKLLNSPVGYTPDVREYKEWLECGIKAIEKEDQDNSVTESNLRKSN